MSALMWFIVPAIAVALLSISLFRRFADDRFEALTERLRSTSHIVSRAQLVDGSRQLEVALALTDSSVIYESADGQSTVERRWIQEVEYENELSTGKRIVDGKVLRLRCFSKMFEFVLSPSVFREWALILPPLRTTTART